MMQVVLAQSTYGVFIIERSTHRILMEVETVSEAREICEDRHWMC